MSDAKKLAKKIIHGISWRTVGAVRRTFNFWYRVATEKHIYPSYYKKQVQAQPLDEKKIVFLEVRMMELTDNFQLLYRELERRGGYSLVVAPIGAGLAKRQEQYKNSRAALREIASAKYVFINDSSALLSCIDLRKETKVIQTWHACGAFKKFGFSTASKIFGADYKQLMRFPLHKNFSVVTVSSPEVIWAYAEAFHMEDRLDAFAATGISRTDIFYDQTAIAAAREKLRRVVPRAEGKKVLLYAPTFRGRVAEAYSPDEMDLARMKEALGGEFVLLCKHHPFVKERPKIPEAVKDFAYDVTETLSIEELLMVSDICISDYSSLIFEYSLFERPMIFFAYDLEEYFDWRGFYYDYDEMTPGPICRTTEEIIACVRSASDAFDRRQVAEFKKKFMSACDGHATERILEFLS